jgi:predicted nucleotidyltransferase
MESPLHNSIIKTLAYFDLANYPLTKEELFSFLWQPPAGSYSDFLNTIGGLNSKFGYYFLPGREEVVEIRRRKLLISEEKLKIARRAAKIIRSVPYLRAVFVCNTAGSGQANEDSDIDFFIITEKNRIWITRLFVTFLLTLFGLRRVGKKVKNKICLSFYVTTSSLDLAKWRIADDDIHFAYWLNQMLPIFDPDNYYTKFLGANSWTKNYLPNLDPKQTSSYLLSIPESKFSKIWKKAWEKMWEGGYGDAINNQAKQIQLSKMKFSGKEIDRGQDKGVVISDEVLKFHEKDTRISYRNDWQQKIQYAVEKNI